MNGILPFEPGAWMAVALIVVPMVLFAFAPRRSLWTIVVLWLLLPVAFYWGLAALEFAARPDDEAHTMANALLGFSLLSAIFILPWLFICALGFGLGWGLRRLRGPQSVTSLVRKPGAIEPAVEPPLVPSATFASGRPPVSLTMDELRATILEHAERYGIPESKLPTLGYVAGDAYAHVLIKDGEFLFGAEDRGLTVFDHRTTDLDELLCWVFDQAAYNVASSDAAIGLRHHREFKGRLLARFDALLGSINPVWQERSMTDSASAIAYYRQQR